MTAVLRPLVVMVLSLFVLTSPATAVPYGGSRVQVVSVGVSESNTTTVNCVQVCILTWHALGSGARLTLRCLDATNETSTGVWPDTVPRLFHPCLVESTLERSTSIESVVVWRANS